MRNIATRHVVDLGGFNDEALAALVAEYGLEPATTRDGLVRQAMEYQQGDIVELSQQEPDAPHTFIRATGTFLYEGDVAVTIIEEPEPAPAKPKPAKKKAAAKKGDEE